MSEIACYIFISEKNCMIFCPLCYIAVTHIKVHAFPSNVMRTGPDRPVRPVRPGIAMVSGRVLLQNRLYS